MNGEIVQVNALPELRAQMETAVDIAKRYPRDLASTKKEIMDIATVDYKTAADCFYAIRRGKTIIEGPSIRLAEIIAYSWQHIRVESRISEIKEETVICEAICWDMQRNVMARKSVSRKILDKNGRRYNEDMINVTGAAGMAIAERNAIFKVIPMAVLKDVKDYVQKKAKEDPTPLDQRIQKALKFCSDMKINRDAVFGFLGVKDKDAITDDLLLILRGALNGIKDGDTTINEVFYPEPEEPDVKDEDKQEEGNIDFSGKDKDGKEKEK